LNSGNPYGTFYDMTNNDYKLVITYKTLVDTEALAKAGGGGELLNAATVEADYCGKIIKESGIKDASNPDAGDNWASVSIQVKGTQAETPTLQNLRKQAVTSSDIVTIGDKTYSYTYDNYLGWYLRIDKDQLAEGSTLVIHDTPTSALTYVADSAIVYDGKSFTKGIHLLDGVTVTQNEDGTIDFNYGTISQALLANANNAPYIYILYQTKLDEETWYKQTATGASASYSNIAEAIYNGESKVKAMSNGTVKAPEVVQKSGVLNQDNQKQLIGADYTIEINKNAADLGYGAETLQVVDTMAASFNLNRMSIKVYEDSIAEENQIKDYTMKYDMATNQITFRVPNKMHVLITYSVVIDVDPIDNPLWYVDTTNSVQVEAFVVDQSKSSVNFASSAADIKVWAYNTNGDITIYKYWNNGEAMTALPGATFRLYSVYDNNGHMYTEADEDYIIKDNITITESDGTITISDLPLDRIYRLQETSSPEGYEKGEDYYFVLQGHYGVTVPEALADKEVAVYESGDTISYENKPSTTEEGSTEAASSETSTETESSTESTTATEAGTTQSETTEKAAPEASTSGATTTEQAVEASPSTGDPAPILAAFLTLLAGAMGILISISKKKRKG
jgi:hypothetical protein